MCNICSFRTKIFSLLAFSLILITGNVVLIQFSLQQKEAKGTEIEHLYHRLHSMAKDTESDDNFMTVIGQLPEVSEQTFFESIQLKNLKIFVYNLPAAFNKDQVTRNALSPPKIWDPNCTANFYSAEYSLHQFLLKSKYRTLDPTEADYF